MHGFLVGRPSYFHLHPDLPYLDRDYVPLGIQAFRLWSSLALGTVQWVHFACTTLRNSLLHMVRCWWNRQAEYRLGFRDWDGHQHDCPLVLHGQRLMPRLQEKNHQTKVEANCNHFETEPLRISSNQTSSLQRSRGDSSEATTASRRNYGSHSRRRNLQRWLLRCQWRLWVKKVRDCLRWWH